MSLFSRRRKRKKRGSADWAKETPRHRGRTVLWLVLGALIAVSLLWAAAPSRTPSIPLELSAGPSPVVARINANRSQRQLADVSERARSLIPSAEVAQIKPLLQIIDAAADRLEQLQQDPQGRNTAVIVQLSAFTDVQRLGAGSGGEIPWHRERFTRLALARIGDPEIEVRRHARACQLLALQLQNLETAQCLTDLDSFASLIADIVREHPGDEELLRLVQGVWDSSPTSPAQLPQLERLTGVIVEQFLASLDSGTVLRGKEMAERFWMVAWQLPEKTEQALLEQDREKLSDLRQAALKLLGSSPTADGIGVSLRLAAALETNADLQEAEEIYLACRDLMATLASPAELAECQRLAGESLERLKLIGQKLELKLETLAGPASEGSIAAATARPFPPPHTFVLQFFGTAPELESLEMFCNNIQSLRPKGFQLVLVPCNLEPAEVADLLLSDGRYRFETLTPDAARQAQRSLRQSDHPRTAVIADGRLVFSGLPNRRLYLELERQAFSRPSE